MFMSHASCMLYPEATPWGNQTILPRENPDTDILLLFATRVKEQLQTVSGESGPVHM